MTAARHTPGEWIEWAGGECPVDPLTLVLVKLRDGATYREREACYWKQSDDDRCYWTHEAADHNNDIIAYRVVSQ